MHCSSEPVAVEVGTGVMVTDPAQSAASEQAKVVALRVFRFLAATSSAPSHTIFQIECANLQPKRSSDTSDLVTTAL